jgi:hypothetical protein
MNRASNSVQAIDRCRMCGNRNVVPVLDLGDQSLTGAFPSAADQPLTKGPLELVQCRGDGDSCGLVQLRHTFDPGELYGEGYGYRSGLNRSMVEHLRAKCEGLRKLAPLKPGDVVLDIGSNDGTLLSFYPAGEVTLIGMDPTGAKFHSYYRPDVKLVPDFFSAKRFLEASGGRKARIVTSIAMFYDLQRPMDFVREVEQVLADDGIWHLEQSHLALMLQSTAYDTVCHEHLEYYALRQIQWLADRAGLRILDVELNDINGGSFNVTLAKASSKQAPRAEKVQAVVKMEEDMRLGEPATYEAFAARVARHRDELMALLEGLRRQGRKVLGYGASTKGNVILQYCGLTPKEIPCIAEVNPDKFGHFTPGTKIPIVSEAQAKALKPDYFLVLPWHFRKNLMEREAEYLRAGGRMIFPLPQIEIVPP